MLNINEIDFLVDIECKSFFVDQLSRFVVLDNSNVNEKYNDENSTMLFFESKTSAVLAYNRLVSLPETFLLWDLSDKNYAIVIKNNWLLDIRNQQSIKIPTYLESKQNLLK